MEGTLGKPRKAAPGMRNKQPVVSIIIVNYHVKKELFACLESLKQSTSPPLFEIIVVDNDEKKTLEKPLKKRFPNVLYIPSPGNIGFGAGNNLGVSRAKGEFLFFLNPDTTVSKNTIQELVRFLKEHNQTGIVAPLLVDNDNKPFPLQGTGTLTPFTALFAHSFLNKLFPQNPVSKKFWLTDWDKKSDKKVNAAPGTAFMTRNELFREIGGFDEKLFLYFEEDDLGKRITNLGKEIYIIAKTNIFHAIGKSMEKSKANTSDIFLQSRFYYFKKHFGMLQALLIEFFLRLRKSDLLFLLIFVLGIFLRFFHKHDNFYFDGEIGDNLLDIKNYYVHQTIPLLGPPTSHPWLYFGPLFYWLYGPVLVLSKFNPVSYTYFGTVFSCLVILANYVVIRKLFTTSTALISSYLIAISPLFLDFAKNSRFFTLIPFVVYPFLFVLYKISNKATKAFFLLGLLLGIMLNFHYTPLMLIPFIAGVLFIKRLMPTKKQIFQLVGGFVIPLSPFFLYDFLHGIVMTRNLVLWIPYRILGFLGIYHKNTLSGSVLKEDTLSFGNFFSASFFHTTNSMLGYLMFAILLVIFLFVIKKTKKTNRYPLLFVLLWGLLGLAAIFVHGNPPSHYFVPILSFPVIIGSILLSKLWQSNWGKALVTIMLIVISLINFRFFFSPSWFYDYQTNPRSIARQEIVAKSIVADAGGQPFSLKRVGFNDQFDKNYAQNYIYLLWLYGNEPVNRAYRTYIIYESPAALPSPLPENEIIFKKYPGLAIIREDL